MNNVSPYGDDDPFAEWRLRDYERRLARTLRQRAADVLYGVLALLLLGRR